MNRVIIHLDTLTVSQILKQNASRYFSHYSKMFFPVQNYFPKKGWETLGYNTFKE